MGPAEAQRRTAVDTARRRGSAVVTRRRLLPVLLLLIALLAPSLALARERGGPARPRLVVLIVIDQFRQDFLTRFAPYFGPDGFNGLKRRGASFTGAHYRHAMTLTGPGHALIISGSYGHRNSMVANNWYNRATGR